MLNGDKYHTRAARIYHVQSLYVKGRRHAYRDV